MGKKKASVIAIAILTCIVCVSMIAGATFALFTDNDKVNVSVTTAKLDVSAEIADVQRSSNGTDLNDRLFAEYNAEEKLLTVDNMLPGDLVTFKVTITSAATVDVKYRVNFGCVEKESALFDQLLLGVKDSVKDEYQYYVSSTSAWDEIEYNADSAKMVKTKYVAIELPAFVNSKDVQEQTCNIEFAVEAVQANASGEQYEAAEKSVKAYRVSESALTNNVIDDDVIGQLQNNGECIVLDGTSVHNWTIKTDLAKEFSVKGCDVDTLTVDAPNATIHYFVNSTQIVNVERAALQSFHVYGAVAQSLTVKEGRAVVEEGAKVASATVAPTAEAEAILVANADIAVLGVEGEGKVSVEVAEAVTVEKIEVSNVNDESNVVNNGIVCEIEVADGATLIQKVSNDEDFTKAIALGGEIVLVNNVELNTLKTNIAKDVVIDLNEKVLSGAFSLNAMERVNLTIVNGTLDIDAVNANNGLSAIYLEAGSVLDMNNVKLITNAYGIYVRGNIKTGLKGIANVTDCVIDCTVSAIGTNASDAGDRSPVEVNLVGTTITSEYCGVLMNIPGDVLISGCDITAVDQAVLARGGNITIKNSTLTTTCEYDYAHNLGADYPTWQTGTVTNSGALVMGNQNNNSYKYPTTVSLEKVTLNGSDAAPAIYMWSHKNYDCTLNYDAETVINGGFTIGGNNNFVNGVAMDASKSEGVNNALEANLSNLTIVLNGDMDLAAAISLTDSQSLTLDLNNKTLTVDGKKLVSTGTGAPIAAKGNSSLRILNGTIEPKNYRSAQSTIDMYGTASVEIEHVKISRLAGDYRSYGYGISAFGNGTIIVNDCTIEAGCAISTNASENITPTITINNSKLEGYATGLLFNVNGTLNVTDTEIIGINQGVFMRAGTATFTNSTIRTTLQNLGTTNMITISQAAATGTFNPYYTDPNGKDSNNKDHWGSGTQNIPLAALVIGCSKPGSSYCAHASVTLVNTKVDESEEFLATKSEDVGMIHHAILAWNAHGEGVGSATLTMDDASEALLNGTVCTVVGMDYSKAVIE